METRYSCRAWNLAEICSVILVHIIQTYWLFGVLWSVNIVSAASKCPTERVLYPCKCHHNEQIICTEPMTYSLGHIFKAIRRSAANVPIVRSQFKELILSNQYIEQLDDNQFHSIRFEKISLVDMSSLNTIKSNAFNGTQYYVRTFVISGENKLGRQNINQLFDALSSLVNVREMNLELNNLHMIPNYVFRNILGPSHKIRLERLRISSRSLTQISSYAFYELPSLRFIKIHTTIGLQRVSAHAFDINQTSNHQLIIDLRSNQMTLSSFELDSFHSVGRPVQLRLTHNNLTTIPREIFERFLNTDQQNVIHLEDNPLECDCTVYWLLKERQLYINQIDGAVCELYYNLWLLDENTFRGCDLDHDYQPSLIFRNSAILFFANHLVLYPIILQFIL